MKQYIRFTERNSWEGETWYFYLAYNDPIDIHAANQIAEKIKGNSSYKIDLTKMYDEKTVDTLVSNSESGYMNMHNKVTRILPEFPEDWAKKSADELFYKGRRFEVANG